MVNNVGTFKNFVSIPRKKEIPTCRTMIKFLINIIENRIGSIRPVDFVAQPLNLLLQIVKYPFRIIA